jgi:hypothetical protein
MHGPLWSPAHHEGPPPRQSGSPWRGPSPSGNRRPHANALATRRRARPRWRRSLRVGGGDQRRGASRAGNSATVASPGPAPRTIIALSSGWLAIRPRWIVHRCYSGPWRLRRGRHHRDLDRPRELFVMLRQVRAVAAARVRREVTALYGKARQRKPRRGLGRPHLGRRCGLKRQAAGHCPPLAFPLARRNGQAARTANAIPTNEAPARTRFALLLSGAGLRRMWRSRRTPPCRSAAATR